MCLQRDDVSWDVKILYIIAPKQKPWAHDQVQWVREWYLWGAVAVMHVLRSKHWLCFCLWQHSYLYISKWGRKALLQGSYCLIIYTPDSNSWVTYGLIVIPSGWMENITNLLDKWVPVVQFAHAVLGHGQERASHVLHLPKVSVCWTKTITQKTKSKAWPFLQSMLRTAFVCWEQGALAPARSWVRCWNAGENSHLYCVSVWRKVALFATWSKI